MPPLSRRGIRGCDEMLEDPHVRRFLQVAGLTVGTSLQHSSGDERKVIRQLRHPANA